MTSEKPDQDNEVNQLNAEKPPNRKARTILWPIFTIVTLLAIAALGLFNFKTIEDLKNDNSGAELINRINSDIEQIAGDMNNLTSTVGRFDSEISSLSAAIDQSNESLEILFSNTNNSDRRISIAEVEHLVRIANIKLQLEQNINLAIVALEEANNRLASMGDPGLFSIRRQITSDINTLKSLPRVDIAGMSFALSDLAKRVDDLPLKSTGLTNQIDNSIQIDPVLPAWKRLLLGVWREFKSMFIITRTGNGINTSLLPNEKYFLYQNLRLQLESARLAVLNKDKQLLVDSLGLAETWIGEYFDISATPVLNAIEIISELKTRELVIVVPDINGSLEMINNFLAESQAVNSSDVPSAEQP